MRPLLFRLFKGLVQLFSGKRLRRFTTVDRWYHMLFNWLRPEMARAQGHIFFVDPNDQLIARNLLLRGVWEPFGTEVFQKQLEPGMVVFCLGAHVGYFALLAARKVGENSRVYAFEPSPDSFRLLVRNIELNGYRNIIPVRKAVSNFNGEVKLYLHPSDTGDHRIYLTDEVRSYVVVDSVRLDDWVQGNEKQVDFIQMDIQGAEMAALEGMEDFVRGNRTLKIVTELWPEGLKACGSSADAYIKRLSELGFKLHIINEDKKALESLEGPRDLERYCSFLAQKNHSLNLLCLRE